MKLIADIHIHTVASGHAFSTIQEIAKEAKRAGLEIFGVSDHGSAIEGAPSYHYFRTLKFVPRTICGVTVLRGAEANIMSEYGDIDIPEHCLERLDYTMAGFHDVKSYNKRDAKTNTKAMINVMDNPYVKIITHPGNPKFPVDYEEVAAAAKEKDVALEINNGSFMNVRPGSAPNCKLIAKLIAKYGSYTVIGSDAHISFYAGRLEEAAKMAKDSGVREEQVINSDKDILFDFLNIDLKR